VKAFYLNLDLEAARRRFIEKQLAEIGIRGERIEAVDGSKPLPPELAPHFSDKHVMDAGALGCYASHIKAWTQMVMQNLPFAVVLEDDAILDRNLASILSEVMAALPRGWDIVHLATKPDRAVCTIAKLQGRKLVQYSRIPPGAVAYLLSWAGAQKLLLAEPRVWPIDTDTRRPWAFGLNVYGVTAPPIKHNWLLPSTIRARGRKRWSPRRGLRAAFGNPIRNSKGFLFNLRRLGPLQWCRCLILNTILKARASLRQRRSVDSRSPLPQQAGADRGVGRQPVGHLQPG
jgi:glycosyl transferase, family 25